MMPQETNLVNLIAKFGGSDEKCRTYLEHLKWPEGPKCDLCGSYLIVESKKGMSTNQLKRTLEVSYKTACYLCHRIRKAMTEVNPSKLSGIVEIDETYVGGKKRYVGRGSLEGKTMVLGAIQRGGEILTCLAYFSRS